jgi:hypothetical protein
LHNLDLGRFYVWFLFVISILTALARLGLANAFAEQMTAKFAADPRKRVRQRWWGWAVLVLSPIILFYGLVGHIRPWMWAAVGIGMVNGVEQLLTARYPDRASLVYLSRIFGAFHTLAAVLIWFLILRYPAVR